MKQIEKLLQAYRIQPEEIEPLEGYASSNFRVKSEGTNYLIKHYSDAEEFDLIREEGRILESLSDHQLPFQIPKNLSPLQPYEDGSFSRLLPFVEGQLLSAVEQTSALLEKFGEAAGLMNLHLSKLKSDSIKARTLFWDMKHTLLNCDKIAYITNPEDRKVVVYYLDLFEHHVVPIQEQLRKSIIHSDLNDNNVIVDEDSIKGFIDFGDIAYSPLIYEVAIALSYLMLANENDPFEKAQAFLNGYHNALPLKKEEIELLYLLIPARLCVSVCNSAQKKAQGEDTEYVLINEQPAWRLLHQWISINPIWITKFFLESVGMKTELPDLEQLKNDREQFTGKSLGTSYKEPIYMTGGAFQYMYDHQGNTYLDAYNNIPQIGHCHPNISLVISKQVRKLNTNTRYLYPEIVQYAKAVTQTLPSSLSKLFYVNSGSAASDLAIRMARTHTGQQHIAVLENGYHGNTLLGIDISDYKHNGKGGSGKPDHVITLPLPKTFNGKFKSGQEYAQHAIQLLSEEIVKGNHPCALIVEPISGCGGQVPLAEDYLKTLQAFLHEHHILLIADEVQTGFGRLGKYFWGFEMHGVIPDIVILGKPMGNGHPTAAVITTHEIAESFANGMEFFTSFGGNPVSCSVATEVLTVIQDENLQANAAQVGDYLKKELLLLQQKFDCIGDVRGEGLFQGIEFVSEEIAGSIKEGLKKRFILSGTDGPLNNVIKIKPPLCFTLSNATHFIQQMEEILKQITLCFSNKEA